MKKKNGGQYRGHRPCFRQVSHLFCAALLTCLPLRVVYADVSPVVLYAGGEQPVVSQQAEIQPALSGENEEAQQDLVSASFSADGMVPDQSIREQELSGEAESYAVASGGGEQLRRPYSLLLALLAVIGVVSVARRSH